jgi:hypothetical protein
MSSQTNLKMYLMIVVASLVSVTGNARADYTFGMPTNLGPVVNSGYNEWGASISSDGLELYFAANRADGYGAEDLWVTTRDAQDAEWGTPVNLGPTVNSSSREGMPRISADGLALYFMDNRPGGSGDADLWVTTRETVHDEWGSPVNLGPTVNSTFFDGGPAISSDGLDLYFVSDRPGGSGNFDLWVTTRATPSDPWGEAVNLGPTINSSVGEWYPSISADGLVLFFQDDNLDMCLAQRRTTTEPFGPVVKLPPQINTSGVEGAPSVSSDGSTLYFSGQNRPGDIDFGVNDIWQVSIDPIVDFNYDGIVNIKDLIELIEHWGENEPAYDMGPMPWGDGIIDAADLEVLMDHWGQEYGLLAHWMLDETEGDVAYDSAGLNDAALNGNPLWQPGSGMTGGALQFDGQGDYVATPVVMNPADGPFSVFAWIKGGGPGQVIMSQGSSTGASWLGADSLEGHLISELSPGRRGGPLESQTVITDGNWHHVGFTWDGSKRVLYVDDAVVVEDTQSSLTGASAGLRIGASRHLEPGTFWSGMIDDVRIYDRVVAP